jgi:hypothetical protein
MLVIVHFEIKKETKKKGDKKNAYGELTYRKILIRKPKSVRIRRIRAIRVPFDLIILFLKSKQPCQLLNFFHILGSNFLLTDDTWVLDRIDRIYRISHQNRIL